jgi:hypothetical protein
MVKPNTICGDYLIIKDFYPTILEKACIKDYQTVQQVDGKSFVPMLKKIGVTAENLDLFWHFPNNWGS